MKLRNYVIALVIVVVLGVCGVVLLLPTPHYEADIAQINDISYSLSRDFDLLDSESYELPESDYDYAVIDADGNLLGATRRGLSEDVYSAVRNGDSVLDITREGELLGRMIISNSIDAQMLAQQRKVQILAVIIVLLIAATALVFMTLLHRQILRPFQNMKAFAQRVAAGELDAPLDMDRHNAFGAFTESFDLMREELRQARTNEQAAEQSKRELVASLSHDIQTPLSSIKAVAEVMDVTADDAQKQKLKTIQEKSSQIQNLVNELFHTTLEELDSLSVQPIPVASSSIAEMIRAADYRGVLKLEEPFGCLVQADPARLTQVMDNIIANSYKYADTEISATTKIEGDSFVIAVRDFGPGVSPDDLPRLCIKYFRGASAEGKNGYGLGLFIAQHLVERMGGQLECLNANPGFVVRISLSLAG